MKIHYLSIIVLIACVSCHPQEKYQYNEGNIFHTDYHIVYCHDQDLHQGIYDCLQKLDASLSMFNPTSTISRINQAQAGEEIYIGHDSLMLRIMEKSMEISGLTKGAFDISVAPLVNLWGFGLKGRGDIQPEQIKQIKSYVGYQKLSFCDSVVIKPDSRMQLDASAIAKGYACDVVGEWLQSHQIENYMVEIGGEIRMAGLNAQKKIWTIGIDKPQDDSLALQRNLQMKIQLTDKGIATSGNYRNFYLKDGRKIAHTIDPHSGYPVQHSLLSATVIADDCLSADAFATSFMVMGLEKAIHLVDSLPYLSAYFIYSDDSGKNQTWCSPELEPLITPLSK